MGKNPSGIEKKNNKGPAAAMCLVGSEDSKYPEWGDIEESPLHFRGDSEESC